MAHSARTSQKDDLLHRFVATFDALIGKVAMHPPPHGSQEMSFSPQEVRSLMWLSRNDKCLMSQFANGLEVPLSTATNLVNRLVEKGFVVRSRSEQDRRVVEVELSEMGKRIDKQLYEHRVALSRRLLEPLTPKEQSELVRLLDKAVTPPKR